MRRTLFPIVVLAAAFAAVPLSARASATAVATGGGFVCAVVSGGVKCWGVNDVGQLGDGTRIARLAPVDVVGLTGVKAVTATSRHACALTTSGGVKCWGVRLVVEEGGSPYALTPYDVTGLTSGVAAVTAGWNHNCALTTAGGVKCWGSNTQGVVGDGTYIDRASPVDVVGLSSGATAIAAGASHTCAVTSAAAVVCWGDSSYGQLGQDTHSPSPVEIPFLNGVRALAAGVRHTCALTAEGVECWGDNTYGQLGDYSTTSSTTPVGVFGLPGSSVTAIASGSFHSCALRTTGAVECWGRNNAGQIGDGTTHDSLSPASTATAVDAVALASGNAGVTMCAVTRAGGVQCWGGNSEGQLLDATPWTRATPVLVAGVSASGILTARANFSCLSAANGTVQCWGENAAGQLGDGTVTNSSVARSVSEVGGVTSLSAGPDYACAVTSAGSTRCWGGLIAPRTGYGYAPRPVPLAVPVFNSGIASIAAGASHVCVLTTGGGVKCWGSNFNGQLGNGSDATDSSATFIDVVGLASGVTAITAGDAHTCAIAGGGVKCWGYNVHGELGIGTTVYRVPTPTAVVGLGSGVAAISAGTRHTCALTTTGGVKCWGSDFHGELGSGDWTGYSDAPLNVVGLSSGATAITTGGAHTCAVKDGAAMCWGTNSSGQVGDGSAADRYAPVTVAGASSGIQRIAAGDAHSCALRGDGRVACWGSGTYGQLGDGRLEYSATPIDVGGLAKAPASVSLTGLDQPYNGIEVSVYATTNPWGMTTVVTYTGINGTVYGPSTASPVAAGSYRVVAVINDTDYAGSATGVMRVRQFAAPTFTDTLQARATPVRAVHVTELRQAIDRLRAFCGLPAFAWTDPSITTRVTPVKASHLVEMRTALAAAIAAQGLAAPAWAPATVVPRSTTISAAEFAVLRTAIGASW